MKFIYCLFFLVFGYVSFGQERCGSMVFNSSSSGISNEESKTQFENWLKTKKNQKLSQLKSTSQTRATVYQIPVVVHVVHNGENLGDVGNIPTEQILSQITTLNEDFRRTNADQSETPDDFLDVAADVEIEFVLAKRDPEGLPSDGIVRVVGNQSEFTIHEGEELAANSYWPAEAYFNIWVADLIDGSGDLLGFAKFPVSNEPGMDDDPNLNRMIDGVFMDYKYFGTGYNTDDFSKGRTMTHEVGHWLGLRHIWGDGGCSVDDFCDDTPMQAGSSSFNKTCEDLVDTDTCTEHEGMDMYQNYLDYTADECMNLFTECQKDRMRIVMENSPRRKELLVSNGAIEPSLVANDLGIRTIESPHFGNCELVLEPEIEVRNYGTNDITEFSIDLLIDDQIAETVTIIETLTPLQAMFVDFSSNTVSADTENFSFKVNQVNGTVDQNVDNDCKWISIYFPEHATIPFVESFEDVLGAGNSFWQIRNSGNNLSAWEFGSAPKLTVENEAAILNYHGSSNEKFGELDYLISPVFDLSDLSTADIKFKYAYSGFPNNYSDALTVVVSTDCGASFPEDQVLFRRIGAELSTTASTSSLFVPQGPSDWGEYEEDLNEFLGAEVVIAFIGNNGGGNNIYLDDVEIFSTASHDFDIGIYSVESLPIVSCAQETSLALTVKNYGKEVITNFSIAYTLEGDVISMPVTDVVLESGKTERIELEPFETEEGYQQILISVNEPNGMEDEDISNNSETNYFVIDNDAAVIPIREKFSSSFESSDWSIVRTDVASDWIITTFGEGVEKDYAATFNGYDIVELGIKNWLVSPVLDFSNTREASMTFDLSYANKVGRNDELNVLVSTNCGNTYPFEIYSKKGSELAVSQSETAWLPDTVTDWRKEFVNLDDFVGASEVRVAFVVTNQNGNNLYLDNIEFYESSEVPIVIEESMKSFPNPANEYVEVKFNFNIKEEILLRIVSLDGDVIAEQIFPNTLNQVYRLNQIQTVPNGMYLLQVLGNNTNLSDKILIQQ
ncbi:T9SS-dependent choice-of-anchor J family protein [Reichenbachiella faecimaris]|uniref:T9SS-dependent choice-of-anchor J family protein n=1 Tax=Reichenbachiella faecimaris TaxID=692418 RepID=UPI0015947F3C|nr:choice-of-anchor J domain-containing protein [Reichenbachiella faecimaris]